MAAADKALEVAPDSYRAHRLKGLVEFKLGRVNDAESLYARAGMERKEAFNFHAVRCDRVVKNVFERIQQQLLKTENSAPKS